MYYQNQFLDSVMPKYLREEGLGSPLQIIPDRFFAWMFPRLVEHRLPLYQAIADQYGVVVEADQIDNIRDEDDFIELVCEALP